MDLKSLSQRIQNHRMNLHLIPEEGYEEFKTKAYLLDQIKDLDCTIHEVDPTGLILYFNASSETTIAFRADMDALPIEEKTGLPYASTHLGKMHACGHDGHMSILLGLAEYIHKNLATLKKNVVLIFQPSEEKEAGAMSIINSGLLEKYQVQAVYGLHLWPGLEAGKIYTRPNEFMAQASETDIKIIGKAAHVASSGEGVDALHAASKFLTALYEIEANMEPDIYRLMKFGQSDSGTIRNIISAETNLYGTVRSFYPQVQARLKDIIRETAKEIEQEFGCQFEITYNDGYKAVINDEKLYEHAIKINKTIQTLENPVMQAEDFGNYGEHYPALFFFLGIGDTAPLHNELFDFDMGLLIRGVELFVGILEG